MKIKRSIPFLFFFVFVSAIAKDNKYAVSLIPPELTKNAKAVIRIHKQEFIVNSIHSATLKTTLVITVLNKNGLENAEFRKPYNKFIRINNIRATIYDEFGNKVKRISTDKIYHRSAISGFSIYDDNRVIIIDLEHRTVPFTVEYTYEYNYRGLLDYLNWILYNDYNVSIEKSVFQITVPKDFKFRYLEKNLPCKLIKNSNGKNDFYVWEAVNLKALKEEPFSLPFTEYTPVLLTAPSDFEIDGYQGNCETWKDFGNWVYNLNKNRNILNEETKQKLLSLTKNAETDYEKVKILYQYLQTKTRYVSIQLGIGGWQPFPAETVDRLSYGDCKALTNYMKTMLETIGIKSVYTLVLAGNNAPFIEAGFPSSQFNHAFLCVPMKHDTIWLECTSQINPFGYLGNFTDDRDVLLIEENASKLVHTPEYTSDDNHLITSAFIEINLQEQSKANIRTVYKGVYYESIKPVLYTDDQDKKEFFYNHIKIPSFNINSFKHIEYSERVPWIEETLDLSLNNYHSVVGNTIIIPLNLKNKIEKPPKKNDDRMSDIFIRRSFTETDSVFYKFPENYKPEKLPEEKFIQSAFGEYSCTVYSENNTLVYVRNLTLKKGRYPLSMYNDLVTFLGNIYFADDYKAVLTKKTE